MVLSSLTVLTLTGAATIAERSMRAHGKEFSIRVVAAIHAVTKDRRSTVSLAFLADAFRDSFA